MRSVALALLLAAALLSGCVVEEDPNAQSTDPSSGDSGFANAQSEPTQEPVAPEPTEEQQEAETVAPAPHGTPQWTNSSITTGSNPQSVPSFWARQDVAVSNGFGDLAVGDLTAMVSAGGILLQVEDRADYLVQATLEVRAPSEEQARDTLERTRLDHQDSVQDGVLVLHDAPVTDPADGLPPTPVPLPVILAGDVQLIVHMTITLPLPPAVSADLGASSGDLVVNALRGASLEAGTSSGDIVVQGVRVGAAELSASSGDIVAQDVEAERLAADTSSGDVNADAVVQEMSVSTSSGDAVLRGAIDSLDAESSSGTIDIKAEPRHSGKYTLGASSGSIQLRLPADGHGYHADATTSSGDIDIDIPDAKVDREDDDHAEATTPGFDDAKLATSIEATTSSGDIGIQAE